MEIIEGDGDLVVVVKTLGMKQKRRPAQGRHPSSVAIAANVLAAPFLKRGPL